MSLYEKIEANAYVPSTAYPELPSKPDLSGVNNTTTASELFALARALDAYEKGSVGIVATRAAWQKKARELNQEFHNDLAEEHDTASFKGENAIYAQAWEDSHEEGYLAVAERYEELVEFLRKVSAL